jgi:hypothetical protein
MLNFLSNLGSGVARLGSAFGHGAASIGKGIGRGVRRLGELGEDDDQVGLYRTPDFNPNAGRDSGRSMIDVARGPRVIEDFVTAAEDDARADSLLERRNLPIPLPSPPGGPPPLTPAPSLNELRTALPSLPSRPSPPLAAPPAAPKAVPDLVPDMDLDRRNLPIPRLPGHSGGPIPFNSIDAAKYDKVMSHAKRDAEGNFTRGFNRDWKTVAQNVLRGAAMAAGSARPGEDPLGRALGGALTAGAGSAINPQAGYEFAFDVGQRPRMEAETARERAEKDRMIAEIFNQAKLDDLRATTEERRSQAQKNRLPTREPRPTPAWRQVVGPDGQPILVDMNAPENRRKVFTSYVKPADPKSPAPPTAAELAVDPESGMSVEEMADASYNTRGGDRYVFDRLPARTRQILSTGKNAVDGTTRNATQAEIDDAQKEFERAVGRQRKTDLDYTRGVIRRKRVGGSRNKASASASSQPTANLKDLEKLWR